MALFGTFWPFLALFGTLFWARAGKRLQRKGAKVQRRKKLRLRQRMQSPGEQGFRLTLRLDRQRAGRSSALVRNGPPPDLAQKRGRNGAEIRQAGARLQGNSTTAKRNTKQAPEFDLENPKRGRQARTDPERAWQTSALLYSYNDIHITPSGGEGNPIRVFF